MPSRRAFATVLPLALALAAAPLSAQTSAVKPDDNRFSPVELIPAGELDEPMAFSVAKDGTVYIVERKGAFKKYDAVAKRVSLIATIPVNTKYTSAEGRVTEAEEGLMGITLDPGFERNRWVYLYWAHPTEKKHVLSRWELRGDSMVAGTQKVVLEVPTQRETCCHTGGGMTWDSAGNLYLTVGNNTGNTLSAHTDERTGRASWDDQRGAASTDDLRGKILRIHPEPDGTYSIPSGNLFPPGTPKTRPEVYTMGHRNAWRVSIDSKTGWMYWGEVGPDAATDTEIGPRGYDELNRARGPGFFGWPYFVGDQQAFPFFDYAANKPLAPKDPARPTNTSVNNTGLTELPPAQPPLVTYPYGISERFPEVGSGSRSATGGPVYRRADFPTASRPYPEYYEGKWLAADLMRGWIMAISMDDKGEYASMERFSPRYNPAEIIDLKFGPEGDLYVLEYGSTWFAKSNNAKLVRIEYNAGNRAPVVLASASAAGGVVPLRITLSSEGTKDWDNDALTYQWRVAPAAGGAARTFATANPTVTFDRAGVYMATLTATDASGARATSEPLRIVAGNEPPVVAVDVSGNRTFNFAGAPLTYAIAVRDREDGSLGAGSVSPARVAVSIDYVPATFDTASIRQGTQPVDATTRFAVSRALIAKSDCMNCHVASGKRTVGPTFDEVAGKYQGDASALDRVAEKIIKGSTGTWGTIVMPPHAGIEASEARAIAQYVLSVYDKSVASLPTLGSYTPPAWDSVSARGAVILRAAYTDRGAPGAAPHTTARALVLRSPQVSAVSADTIAGAGTRPGERGAGEAQVIARPGTSIGFRRIDLTGIVSAGLLAQAPAREGYVGGTVELRLDSPTGALLGQADVRPAAPPTFAAPTASQIQAAAGAAGAPAPSAAAPRPATGFRPPRRVPIRVALKETTGVHDLYLVFRNDAARPIEPLFLLSSITFENR